MDNEHKKLEHFTATILSDANERSRKILEALEKARKARLAAAEKRSGSAMSGRSKPGSPR